MPRRNAHDPFDLALDLARHRRTRCRAADVEGTHRQLRARLADRLRGNDAHRLADVDQRTTAQIAAVALRAQAVARIAGQRRAHLDFVDAARLDCIDRLLIEQRA